MSYARLVFALTLCTASAGLAEELQPVPAGRILDESCDEANPCVKTLRCKDGVCQAPLVSYPTYKVVHLAAVLTLLFLLGGLCALAWADALDNKKVVRGLIIAHGVVMLLAIAGGFGLMARLGIAHGTSWPLWVKLKLGLWLVLGAAPMLPRRMPRRALLWMAIILGLAVMAASFAVNKPL